MVPADTQPHRTGRSRLANRRDDGGYHVAYVDRLRPAIVLEVVDLLAACRHVARRTAIAATLVEPSKSAGHGAVRRVLQLRVERGVDDQPALVQLFRAVA